MFYIISKYLKLINYPNFLFSLKEKKVLLSAIHNINTVDLCPLIYLFSLNILNPFNYIILVYLIYKHFRCLIKKEYKNNMVNGKIYRYLHSLEFPRMTCSIINISIVLFLIVLAFPLLLKLIFGIVIGNHQALSIVYKIICSPIIFNFYIKLTLLLDKITHSR